MILPSTSPITLGYNSTDAPYSTDSPHKGVDFAYTPDNKIYAPFTGKVTLIPNNGRDGNGIYMYNGDQFHGMLHTSQYLVASGTTVTEGQVIGLMGDTGFAQGVHLHWCVQVNGVFIDPLTLLDPSNLSKGEIEMVDQEMAELLAGLAYFREGDDRKDQEFTSSVINQDPKTVMKALLVSQERRQVQNVYVTGLRALQGDGLTDSQKRSLAAFEALKEALK